MKKFLCLFFTSLALISHVHSANLNWTRPPVVLSGTGVDATNPQIAIDASGNVIAAWVENNLIKASNKPVSGSWSSAVTISGSNSSAVSLVMDSNGNSTAVWIEGGITKAASKTLAGSWSSSTSLSTSGASAPALAVDTAGNVIAAWVRSGNVETSTKPFGSNWQGKLTLTSSAAATPSISIGGTGSSTRAVVVWQGTSGTTKAVFASTKGITGSWTSSVQISDTEQNAAQPYVAVDSNANALAIWYAYDLIGNNYADVIVQSAERNFLTGNWSNISTLSLPGIRNPATLKAYVAYDTTGNAVAIWNTSYDDETFALESAVKPVFGYWSSGIDLANANLYGYSASVSATTYGNVCGLYMFYNGANLMIQSIESDINGFSNNVWSVPITISQGTDNAYPKIAATLNGDDIEAAAVWVHYDGSNSTVIASNGSKTLVLPPSSLSVTQSVNNLGVFNEYYNTLSWSASTDPNAVGYLIFRNGTFLEEVDASTLSFVDNNRTFNGAVTYGVAAIDSQQMQSRTVNINFP